MGELACISGGAGLIGSHIVDLLLAKDYEVRVLDSLDEQTHPNGVPPWASKDVEWNVADVRHPGAWARAVKGVDLVFHQAALGGFSPASADYLSVNAIGTALMFDAIREFAPNCRRVVVASSQAVYGEGMYQCGELSCGPVHPGRRAAATLAGGDFSGEIDWWCPVCTGALEPILTPESMLPDPFTMYGVSKLAQERTALVLGRQLGIPTIALRYAVTYGPRQSLHNPYTGIVSIFASRLRQWLPAVIYEDGCQTRDFIAVADVARANLAAAETEYPSGAYNVGTGRATRVLDLAQAVATAIGVRCDIQMNGAYRPGDIRHLVHQPGALSPAQPTSLADGLRAFAEWFDGQPLVPDRFDAAQAGLRAAGVVVS